MFVHNIVSLKQLKRLSYFEIELHHINIAFEYVMDSLSVI